MTAKSLREKFGSGLDRIAASVGAAEKTTSAEIAVFIREWTFWNPWHSRADEKRIRAHAEKLFIKNGLDKTRDRNAVMLYVSLRERTAVVLGDTGIHKEVADGAWDSITASIAEAARKGLLVDGIVTAVGKIGTLLSAHFPLKSDDTNELPDAPNIG